MRVSRRRFLSMAGAVAVGGAGYAFGIEPTWFRTVVVEPVVPGLPAAFDGYLVAQVSDLHVGSGVPLDYLASAVDAAVAAAPDLAVVTGDLTDEHGLDGAAEDAAAILAGLRARDGVLAVLGNHDTGAVLPGRPVDPESVRRVRGAVERAGVRVLSNETAIFRRAGAAIGVAGFGDLWSGMFRPAEAGPPPTVALSHNPDTAPELARRGAGLVLSGHTHGGQVRLPYLPPPYVPVRHKEFVKGLYPVDGAVLHVNPGLGFTHRVRFCARPEVTLLRLRARSA